MAFEIESVEPEEDTFTYTPTSPRTPENVIDPPPPPNIKRQRAQVVRTSPPRQPLEIFSPRTPENVIDPPPLPNIKRHRAQAVRDAKKMRKI